MFNAIENFPCIQRKAAWAQKVQTNARTCHCSQCSAASPTFADPLVHRCFCCVPVDQIVDVVRRAPRRLRSCGGQCTTTIRPTRVPLLHQAESDGCALLGCFCNLLQFTGHLLLGLVLRHFLVEKACQDARPGSVQRAHLARRGTALVRNQVTWSLRFPTVLLSDVR